MDEYHDERLREQVEELYAEHDASHPWRIRAHDPATGEWFEDRVRRADALRALDPDYDDYPPPDPDYPPHDPG